MLLRGAFLAGMAALVASGAQACDAITDGIGLPGRFAEVTFSNTAPRGQHENWIAADAQLVMHAGFDVLTSEYGHNIMGPLRDTKELAIHVRQAGDTSRITCPKGVVLPEGQVFEDIAPRLVDVDGDGLPEVITVQSDVKLGARLAIYDRRGKLAAATPNIGRTNRWLAPIGAADLDGDGYIEIAYIDRPHLARLMRVWRYKDGKLELVAERDGLTNHRIGEDFISGGVRDCGQGPELITVNADWSRIVATTLSDGTLSSRDIGPHRGQSSFKNALACQ